MMLLTVMRRVVDEVPNYGYQNNFISSEVAIEIALQQVPGQVIRVELDTENGVIVYEIHISTTYGIYEVDINARTGQIIKIEREFD